MIDDVRAAFTALRATEPPPAGDLRVVKSQADQRAFLGLDDIGRPHLLLFADGAEPPASDIATLEIGIRRLTIDGTERPMVDIACLFEAMAEVFDHFVVATLERLETPGSVPVAAVFEVLEQWRQFLLPAAGPAGRDKLASVFGELVVLRDVVFADPARRLDCWVGPFGARHDLRRGATAVEVKTTRSHTSRIVTIHGEDQLLEPAEGELFLHLIRLEEVADAGQSVTSLVDGLLDIGIRADTLFAALAAVGVPPADLAHADHVRFDIRERLTVPIDSESPRIVPESFVGGARPVGVTDVTYRIDLDHVLDRGLDEGMWASLVARLAGVDAE